MFSRLVIDGLNGYLDFHRWRFNEMILATYKMAEKRKDKKTMERAASSYAMLNRIDIEEEQAVPYDMMSKNPSTDRDADRLSFFTRADASCFLFSLSGCMI